MNILIVYATRGGVSRTCAEMLKEKLDARHEVRCCNIEDGAPAPSAFDAVVVGGSIRVGRLNKKLKKYIKEHKATLANMPAAAFICCGFPIDLDDYVETQLPRDLEFSLGVHCFGCEIKPEKRTSARTLNAK